ncbi:MAG: VWA domain-containing protein [Phycisphaeraceae bacterium]|nr:VWA domain-containing protein [Phycisphaeraceae bacterium]
MPITFEHPWWLLLLLILLPLWWLAWHSEAVLGRFKARLSFALRVMVVLLLTGSLARPLIERTGEGVTSLIIFDASRSVPLSLQEQATAFLQRAAASRERPEDGVGLITVAMEPEIAALPSPVTVVSEIGHAGPTEETNLEAALRLALATLPRTTANRILLVSDGNETSGSLIAAAEEAYAAGVPIDVVPLEFQLTSEVVVEELRAPSRVRIGQPFEARVTIRSPVDAPGNLRLLVDDQPIDLDPSTPGDGQRVTLRSGPSQFPIPLTFEGSGARRLRVIFEPDPSVGDAIEENNVGEAIVFVSGEGRVLFVDGGGAGAEVEVLATAMRRSGIDAEVVEPRALDAGAAFMAGFDSVVLANVPRWSLGLETDAALYSYVHDLGGGLVMLGGDQSFGAGGWIDSETAKALPLRLDPPQTRQILRGALALVMHSCEMPQGNYWGKQVAISAIEALTRLDHVGIVVYDWAAGMTGASWAFPMQPAGDKRAALAAANAMQVGDMPDFAPSLRMAREGLLSVKGGVKHAIIISDGDPQAPPPSLLNDYRRDGITITTVLVVGHGTQADHDKMKFMADSTGGRFYFVRNPRDLPQIFIKEASVVSRSLLQEGRFAPQLQPMASGPTKGVTTVPPVDGFVLTVAREGLAQTPITLQTAEGPDPLLAYWNHGLGRAVAFTSDVSGRWGAPWAAWQGVGPFWEQVIRWCMRPPQPRDASLRVQLEGGRATVELESAVTTGAAVQATMVGPDGRARVLPLRQVAAGRWRGEFETSDQGAYLVNAGFASESPDGERRVSSVQAAVSVPYAREFRSLRDNSAVLEAVAKRTGGRVIKLSDTVGVSLFERAGIQAPRTARRVWDLLAILAAALFLVDVASRRLAFDSKEARERAARAMGRVEAVGDASVAAWRKARERAARGDSEPKAGDEVSAVPPPTRRAAPVRPEGQAAPEGEAPRKTPDPRSAPPGTGNEADGLARLREAKRRARGDDRDSQGPEQGGGT